VAAAKNNVATAGVVPGLSATAVDVTRDPRELEDFLIKEALTPWVKCVHRCPLSNV
jgi:hypothetical protein